MADVTLRESLDLMRSFLRAGHLAEAFALGRHILHFYPKHIETYTVLAQVSLATNDMAGANDLLRRVLSSDPENVIALAGMALISEAQDKQAEALWYLERAYEIQPSNDELRGELLRLREQFYGTAPARVELTPGALARVYARQGQYAQAVNEYRRLLKNESRRYDAQVGLAETLYRAGRTDEAAQVAQSVMADAPYALKPNLILGALWSENAVPEGQQFLQRAHQLDPEHRVARDLLGERFDGADPPRLPEMNETPVAPVVLPASVRSNPADAFPPDRDTARAALLLSEIERAQETETAAQELLIADLDVLERVETRPAKVERSTLGADAKIATGVVAVNLVAEALKPASEEVGESAASSQTADAVPEHAPADLSGSAADKVNAAVVEKTGRSKSERVSAEAIAAAASALATSIALDKSNQPAPTRRTHSAIPKVRPVIPGNSETLPSWLYLSATPANANASFDALPMTPEEQVVPLPTQPDRPDWLVQAKAASESAAVSVGNDNQLPDWLKPAAVIGSATAVVTPIDKPSEVPAIKATDESNIAADETPVPAVRAASAAALPEWLREPNAESGPDTSPQEPSVPAVSAADTLPLELPPVPEPPVSVADVAQAETQLDAAVPLAAPAISERADDETPAAAAAPIVDESLPAESSSDEIPVAPPSELSTQETIPPLAPSAAAAVAALPSAGTEPLPAAEERPQTQAQPDSAAMLQMARDKRESGDLKGALELYERVMHRRPNHIEQVTADLEAIVSAGGAPLTANRLLGEAYAMVGRFKESLVQYRTALGK